MPTPGKCCPDPVRERTDICSEDKVAVLELSVKKRPNSSGLQIADLTARPIGRHVIDPNQSNRAWNLLRPKLMQSTKGDIDGWGLTTLPK